jgi:hypothetical protein
MAIESEEVWTPQHENLWWFAYVLKFDSHYWIVKLEGARSGDNRYRAYVHRSTVESNFGSAVVGTKIKLRIRPNRKQDGGLFWESLEAVIEKDLPAQAVEEE